MTVTRSAPAGRRRHKGARLRHRHRDALAGAARRLGDRPLTHAFALALLAVGLLFVALLGLAAERFSQLSTPLSGARSLSLFLDPQLDADRARSLAEELRADARVKSVDAVSPEAGLDELAHVEGATGALAALPENPLPWVLAVEPVDHAAGESLAATWRARAEVEYLADEGEWLDRASAALTAARLLALALGVLVVAALVLVAANAIRTIRVSGAPERALQRVFGATESDLRRPYLYLGALYGVIASVAAVLGTVAIAFAVQPAFASLAALLENDMPLQPGAWLPPVLLMVPAAALLGWAGAWLGCLFEPDVEASE